MKIKLLIPNSLNVYYELIGLLWTNRLDQLEVKVKVFKDLHFNMHFNFYLLIASNKNNMEENNIEHGTNYNEKSNGCWKYLTFNWKE